MSKTSLAVKYRPTMLKSFVGNKATVNALRSMMERADIPHTILFTGPSGTGKTTLARIVSRRLQCSRYDLREMNTADFRGIDTVREIVHNMAIAPMSGSCRVWILDECHNLTKDAQHALLKALEDMPNHVYFLLATTDPGKLLDTIRTRCVTFEVKPLSDDEMKTLVAGIVEKEVVKVPTEVVDQIVFDSQGSARMALTILDKIIGMEPEEMLEAAKQQAADQNEAIALCRALLRKRPWGEVSLILRGIEQEPEQVRRMVLGYAQSVLLKGKEDNGQAYIILAAFREPLYDSGKPGLVAACYEAVH